jgi:hypothetical protein
MWILVLTSLLAADPEIPEHKVTSVSRSIKGPVVAVQSDTILSSGDAGKVYRELQRKHGQLTHVYFYQGKGKYAWIRTEIDSKGRAAYRVQYKGKNL